LFWLLATSRTLDRLVTALVEKGDGSEQNTVETMAPVPLRLHDLIPERIENREVPSGCGLRAEAPEYIPGVGTPWLELPMLPCSDAAALDWNNKVKVNAQIPRKLERNKPMDAEKDPVEATFAVDDIFETKGTWHQLPSVNTWLHPLPIRRAPPEEPSEPVAEPAPAWYNPDMVRAVIAKSEAMLAKPSIKFGT